MNLPSSTPTPTSVTSTSAPTSDTATKSNERCDDCGSLDAWVIHTARLRGNLRYFCTHCLLRNHPGSFCPSCFAFYDSSPPHASRRVTCSNSVCNSSTHIQCAPDAKSPYLCPPCLNPSSFSFFRPITNSDGSRSVDKALSEAFLCAAKISASSMNKAVSAAKIDADRRGKDAALARKRAREALEHVVMLDEKARSAIPKLKEASVVISSDQKPKLSLALNGAVKETENSAVATTTTTTTTTANSVQIKNNGGTEKQNPIVPIAKVKEEGDASK